jgi:hypothetical protein
MRRVKSRARQLQVQPPPHNLQVSFDVQSL